MGKKLFLPKNFQVAIVTSHSAISLDRERSVKMCEINVPLTTENASHLMKGMFVDGNTIEEVEKTFKQVLEASGFPFAFLERGTRNVLATVTKDGKRTVEKVQVTTRRFRCSPFGTNKQKTTKIRKTCFSVI